MAYQFLILKKWSKKLNVDYLILKNVNSKESVKKLESYNADIFVSMSFDQIIKKKLISVPPKGFINCHAGALPFYRGRNVLNWAIINDEKKFGITVHYIDENIDTGDIIKQKLYPITDQDDYGSLLNKAHKFCAQLLFETLLCIIKNKVQRIPQKTIDAIGSYCKGRKEGDEFINWNWNARKIYNFIRAISKPGPYARSNILKNQIIIKKSIILNNALNKKKKPGCIIKIESKKIYVKTTDGVLLITDYSFSNNIKINLKVNNCFY